MPRKRKVATKENDNDSEMMPPPPVPPAVAKGPKARGKQTKRNEPPTSTVNDTATSVRPQSQACPVTVIFEKAQTNESLHVKYFKELNSIYEKVNITSANGRTISDA